MKKVSLVLTMCLLLLFAGCGEPAAKPTPGPEETPAPTVTQAPSPAPEQEQKFESEYYENGVFKIPEVSAAQESALCDGFGELDWGESCDRLFEENIANFAVQYGAEYAGFMGTAYYAFRDGGLTYGKIVFYALPDKSDLDMYIEIGNYLLETYGEAAAASEASNISTLEEVMQTGEGFCAELWHAQTSQGTEVQLKLQFDAAKAQAAQAAQEGGTSISFWFAG